MLFEKAKVFREAFGKWLVWQEHAYFDISFLGGGGEIGGGDPRDLAIGDDALGMERSTRGGRVIKRRGEVIDAGQWRVLGPIFAFEPVEENRHEFALGLGIAERPLNVQK